METGNYGEQGSKIKDIRIELSKVVTSTRFKERSKIPKSIIVSRLMTKTVNQAGK
jgi:hypothetical protein